MPEEIDETEILQRVLQKTKDGKLGWQKTVEEQTFVCVVEGDYTFSISFFEYEGDHRIAFWMTDKENEEVFRVVGLYGSMSQVGKNLTELYDKARSLALDIPRKLREAASILDRI
jgi:hypothetical protein